MTKPRERERLWSPQWETVHKGYAINFIRANKWRCDPAINDFEDLLQDCWMIFLKVKEAYPRVSDPPHFMSLYKTAIFNEFMNKARRKATRDASEDYLPNDVSEFYVNRIGEKSNAGYLAAVLAEAPEEMKLVMDVLVNNRIKPRPRLRRRRLRPRSNLNAKVRAYCKKLGVAIKDPLGDLSKLLSN